VCQWLVYWKVGGFLLGKKKFQPIYSKNIVCENGESVEIHVTSVIVATSPFGDIELASLQIISETFQLLLKIFLFNMYINSDVMWSWIQKTTSKRQRAPWIIIMHKTL
jgi:hypothetical protein